MPRVGRILNSKMTRSVALKKQLRNYRRPARDASDVRVPRIRLGIDEVIEIVVSYHEPRSTVMRSYPQDRCADPRLFLEIKDRQD